MRLNKKLAAVAITATVALTASAAFAYWTTTGAGDGSVTAASSNGTLVLHGIIGDGATVSPPVAGHAPYPGGSNPVTFTADNAGDTDLRLLHVLFRHACGIEHRLRRALRFGLRDLTAVFVESPGHE